MSDSREDAIGGPGTIKLLTGILALLAAEREERLAERERGAAHLRPAEVVLSAAGLSNSDIGTLLGKSPEAVRSTIRRDSKKQGSIDNA